VSISDSSLEAFERHIGGITVEYPYQEHYHIKLALEQSRTPTVAVSDHRLAVFPTGTPIDVERSLLWCGETA
jgi:hypothetical protein